MTKIDTSFLMQKCKEIRTRDASIQKAREHHINNFERKNLLGGIYSTTAKQTVISPVITAISACARDYSLANEPIAPNNFFAVLRHLILSENPQLMELIRESAIMYKLAASDSDMREWSNNDSIFRSQFEHILENQQAHDKEIEDAKNFDFLTNESIREQDRVCLFEIMIDLIDGVIETFEAVKGNYDLLTDETINLTRSFFTKNFVDDEFTGVNNITFKISVIRRALADKDWEKINYFTNPTMIMILLDKAKSSIINTMNSPNPALDIIKIVENFSRHYIGISDSKFKG